MQTLKPSLFAIASSLLFSVAACGDDTATGGSGGGGGDPAQGGGGSPPVTGGNGGEPQGGDGGQVEGGAGEGGAGGAAEKFEKPDPFAVPLSATGPDQLQSVTAAEPGSFFAAGFAAQAVGGPRAIVVVKLSSSGPVDSFGTGGVAVTSTLFVGGSDEIDIATQSDGKILVSATVANATTAGDRDIAVLRLNADGTPDAGFGVAGVRILNLNDAVDVNGTLTGLDGSRSLTVNDDDEIFVHAVSRGVGNASGGGPRVDTDFTVVKLSAAGVQDMDFGAAGAFRLDIQESNATARGIKAMADGSLLASGYANSADIGTTQAVLYKLDADGELVAGFADGGLFHEAILATQTEIYNFAVHGGDVVTAGYGRNTGDTNDYVSLRFDIATGARDLTWGGAVSGAVLVDPSGAMLGSNARNAIGLPGGETVIVGSTGPSNMPTQDAVFVVLDDNGELDTKYLTGIHVFELGNNGNDQFWGGAVSGDFVAIVGYQGGGQNQTEAMNDDAYGVVFPIQ